MQRVWEIITTLKKLPQGSLIHKKIRGYIRYYHQYYENSRRVQKYIRKADEPRMFFLLKLRRQLLAELKELLTSLRKSGKEGKPVLKEYRKWSREERQHKKALEKAKKKTHPEQLIHYALWGEYVRSKSEILIGDLLKRHRIPFHYEKGLELGRKLVHPDFTFYIRGKECYWEHLGLWDQEKYRIDWAERKDLYEQYGICEDTQLFLTKETAGAIDMLEIERQFTAFINHIK